MRSRAPLNGQHPELNRSNVLYLLRVASLTRMNNGAMELTPTGAHFNIKQRQLPRYTNNYAGKFGYTKDPARVRFNTFVSHCQATGFPERLEPVFEMAIIGIPPRRLHQMEHGLRNFLDREEVRLQLHSRSTFIYPENTNMFTERHEFAQTDEQGGGLFDLFDNFTRHLERGRRRAVDAAREADIRQSRAIEARKAPMCIEHQRIHNHKLDEFFRIEQAHWQALAGQPEHVVRVAFAGSTTSFCKVWWLVRPQVSRELRATHHGSTSGQSNTELFAWQRRCLNRWSKQMLEAGHHSGELEVSNTKSIQYMFELQLPDLDRSSNTAISTVSEW